MWDFLGFGCPNDIQTPYWLRTFTVTLGKHYRLNSLPSSLCRVIDWLPWLQRADSFEETGPRNSGGLDGDIDNKTYHKSSVSKVVAFARLLRGRGADENLIYHFKATLYINLCNGHKGSDNLCDIFLANLFFEKYLTERYSAELYETFHFK